MPTLSEVLFIVFVAAVCLLFPLFDRSSIRKLVKEQTGHEIRVPKNRLVYRVFQTFGLGFPVGAIFLPLLLPWSVLDGGLLGGVLGVIGSVVVKTITGRKKKKLEEKAPRIGGENGASGPRE